MSSDPVSLAAQADLVMLTVDMLRPPPVASEVAVDASDLSWFDLDVDQLDELLHAGLGASSTLPLNPECDLTPRAALAEVQRCAHELDTSRWSDEYVRLFDGATACPLNQASYIRRDKGKILGDVSGFYNAFGWRGGLDTGERPDHLLCQLEFVAMLLALASQAPDDARENVVTEALSKFAREHMHDWMASVCWQMCEQSHMEYFGAVSQWLHILWQTLTDIHQWPIDELPGQRVKPIVDPDDPYECGAPDLHQIQSH